MRVATSCVAALVVAGLLVVLPAVPVPVHAAVRTRGTNRAGAWPAFNHCPALPAVADWTALLNTRHADTDAVTTIFRNRTPRRTPFVLAQALAWKAQYWLNTHINPNTPQTGLTQAIPLRRVVACVRSYVAQTVHPRLVASPSAFLNAVTAAISAAPSPAAVTGVGSARQLRVGSHPGAGAVYDGCDYLLQPGGGEAGACRLPAAPGDVGIVLFQGARPAIVQVWRDTDDRGAQWFGVYEPRGNSLLFRVMPAATAGGGARATFLPWKADFCTYTVVAHDAVTAWTSPLTGCQVYVATHATRPPILIHCNAMHVAGEQAKVQAMDTGAGEIVRRSAGYAKAWKFVRAQYFAAAPNHPFYVTPYGARAGANGAGAWQWKAAIIGPAPAYGHRRVNFQRWR